MRKRTSRRSLCWRTSPRTFSAPGNRPEARRLKTMSRRSEGTERRFSENRVAWASCSHIVKTTSAPPSALITASSAVCSSRCGLGNVGSSERRNASASGSDRGSIRASLPCRIGERWSTPEVSSWRSIHISLEPWRARSRGRLKASADGTPRCVPAKGVGRDRARSTSQSALSSIAANTPSRLP